MFFAGDLSLLAVYIDKLALKRQVLFIFDASRAVFGEVRVDSPILLRLEIANLPLSVDHHFKRDGLHSSCRKPALYLTGNDRRKFISHKSVKHSSRLLCVDKSHIYLSGIFQCLLHCLFGNLVEYYPDVAVFYTADVGNVPRYCLSLSIGVGCEIYGVAFLYLPFYRLDSLFLVGIDDILGFKIIVDVHAHCLLRQVADVSLGSHYAIAAAKIF